MRAPSHAKTRTYEHHPATQWRNQFETSLASTDDEYRDSAEKWVRRLWDEAHTHDRCSLSLPEYTGDCAILGANLNHVMQSAPAQSLSLTCGAVVTVKHDAFAHFAKLTAVSMANAQTFEEYAFAKCATLTTVVMDNVRTVQRYAFHMCPALTTVTMDRATVIGDCAFMGCLSLKSVTVGNAAKTATTIGSEAFSGCVRLETVKMCRASARRKIGKFAFSGCTAIATVACPQAALYAIMSCPDGPVKVTTTRQEWVHIYDDGSSRWNGWRVALDGLPLKERVLASLCQRLSKKTAADLYMLMTRLANSKPQPTAALPTAGPLPPLPEEMVAHIMRLSSPGDLVDRYTYTRRPDWTGP